MCGIVGFIGENAVMNVLSGLRVLEYRGYDSAGVAYVDFDSEKISIIKRAGRLVNVTDDIDEQTETWPEVAIGHTRWATHGAPIEVNAHPHRAGNIVLVHNGIIENYAYCLQLVRNAGRIPESETDTELIAHLVDMSEKPTLLEKVQEVSRIIEGSFALAVMAEDSPGEIVVARRKSPLVVGVAERQWSGTVLSSDLHGLLQHTNKAYVLRDGEFAILRSGGISFYSSKSEIVKEALILDWVVEDASLGGFDTFMRKEIQEQPAGVIDTAMKNDWEAVAAFLKKRKFDNALFLACGTSFNACKVGTIFVEANGHVSCRARLASEVYYNTRIRPGTLVVAVSQSGETADTLNAVKFAKKYGAIVLAVVNVIGSSLTREADYVIYTAAGPEISVASTKAFTSQLAVLYMLGGIFEGIRKGTLSRLKEMQSELEHVGAAMKKVLEQDNEVFNIAQEIKDTSVLFLGRGMQTPVAYEGALKLKEISYLHAEGLPAGEIKHGPLALVTDKTPVVALALQGRTYDKMISNIREVKSRGAYVIAIASEGDLEIANIAHRVIYVPSFDEGLSPILSVIPLQLLAYHVAKRLGCDIDKPRNLAKSVTVE